jgi:hypothetical protein
MELGGGTTVGAVESLLTSSCFRKGAESRRRHRACGAPSLPTGGASQMGRRSCSLRPELARGRVMMAPPIDVADLRPRLGDVEAPPKPRSSPSPRVGRGGDCRLVPGRSPSPGVGRSGVRRLLGPSPSPSPGSGEAEFAVFWGRAQVRALGRAEFAVFRDLARVRALGRAERSLPSSGT